MAETLNTRELLDRESKEVEAEFKAWFEQTYPDFDGDLPNQAHAISGGGIRSASFGIGVLQALNNRHLVEQGEPTHLERMRYLSTVSGGGYAGSALSWYQRLYGFFPFGDVDTHSGSQEGDNANKPNATLNYIRQHGKYLNTLNLD